MASVVFSAFDHLYVYAGSRGRETFILQLVADAHRAQTATLIGLYLHVEKNFTGRQVQQVHVQLGRRKPQWPKITLPLERGNSTAEDPLQVPAGSERDAAISDWCRSVWEAYAASRQQIIDLLREHRIV